MFLNTRDFKDFRFKSSFKSVPIFLGLGRGTLSLNFS